MSATVNDGSYVGENFHGFLGFSMNYKFYISAILSAIIYAKVVCCYCQNQYDNTAKVFRTLL